VSKKNPKNIIADRKKEGIDLALKNTDALTKTTLFECVELLHCALPEVNFNDIKTSTKFLGHNFNFPFLIDSMTGGTPAAHKINARLAQAAEEFGIGMGVGSQRAGLLSNDLAQSFKVVRKNAPNAFIFSNIGGAQLSQGLDHKSIKKLLKMIDADALAIHLNPLQELVQPEGESNYSKVLSRIKELSSDLNVPIIVKEVGSGISPSVAKKLSKTKIGAINVAGMGGTSWAGIEQIRAKKFKNKQKSDLGLLFWDWGIPTAATISLTRSSTKTPIIASGGLRNGLDLAKSIALGADIGGYARPMLTPASKSYNSLTAFINQLILELKSTMFLIGAKNIRELKSTEYITTEPLTSWISKVKK
tara:strand:- start:13458 stop:14540 length:1083 start_codon:yes stop_codon:yes gene_type:complete